MTKSLACAFALLALASAQAFAQPADEGNPFADDPPELNINDDDVGNDIKYSEDYGSCGCGGGCSSGCFEDSPWRLFPVGHTGISVTGWISGGATAAADPPADRRVRPMAFNDRTAVVANQIYAVIERPIDTSCSHFDIGGRVDILYGTDARFAQASGLELHEPAGPAGGTDPRWSNRTFYQIAMPQLYAEFGLGAISVKAGHWYTTIGHETVTAPQNFFYSHAYTMAFGEPFTHTGVLMNVNLPSGNSIHAGIHNGWDNFSGISDRAAAIYGATWKNWAETMWVSTSTSIGDEFNALGTYSTRAVYSVVAGFQLTCDLRYILQHDNGFQLDNFAGRADAEWYGLNQYLLYDINDCWSLGFRFEWFRDDDGTRVPGNTGATGFAGSFYEATIGMNWRRNSNFIIRPELRWDWYDGPGNPFSDATKSEQFVGAFDMIMHY